MRLAPLSLVLLLWTCSSTTQPTAGGGGGGGGTLPPPPSPGTPNLVLQQVASGLDRPLDLTSPPGDGRLFVAEQTGAVRIISNGAVLPVPFLDLSGRVACCGERGLLGIAFHPNYAANGRFYVHYSAPGGDTRVSAFTVSADPAVADAASEAIILETAQPFSNHNGGRIAFGPDGFLYIGLGDGGSGGDPNGHGQDRSELLGSILRIDVDGGTPYAIPQDNPYRGSTNFRQELWNYGLRNPWRFSFDRQTGDLYIADVGQNAHEEIDFQPAGSGAGANYGWNIMEGNSCFQTSGCNRSGLVPPVIDYDHSAGACSVTGGYVYRGSAIAGLAGTYFYGDYCAGWVRSFRMAAGQATEPTTWPGLDTGGGLTSFGQDAAGELYVIASGVVYRIAEQ